MKIYVLTEAVSLTDDVMDVTEVEVFLSYKEAKQHFDNIIIDRLSDKESNWVVFSRLERHCQLTDMDNECVLLIAEREI